MNKLMSGLSEGQGDTFHSTLKRRAPNKMCLSPEFLKLVQTRCRITGKMEYCVFQMEVMINELTTPHAASQRVFTNCFVFIYCHRLC